jgi:hypothetical protein
MPCSQERCSFTDQELGSAAGYEDSGLHGNPQSAELGPAQDVFERKSCHPLLEGRGQFRRGKPCG